MTTTIHGTIQQIDLGSSVWALISASGETYELHSGAPDNLLKTGLKVKVRGRIRDDIMTLAMIGPVLEVETFEID